ncbi:hypothetical protein HF086_006473 [Spodoptera exigua]|uniref:Uncharacterized protein n=1 Tax=Spodoptera exigua TaxID=7107 RepID=A0A922MKC0_SPOEX|nr:hypothetical protein HF086_006473 [Spodoptera exigua]
MSTSKSTELSTLVRQRGNIRGRLTTQTQYINTLKLVDCSSLSNAQVIEIKLHLKKCETLYKDFETFQDKIELLCDESEIQEQINTRSTIENQFITAISTLQDILEKLNPVNVKSQLPSQSNESSVKLPTIKLPVFDGSYLKWLEFRDTYLSLIHENASIQDINKFHYLRASLEGSASEALGIPTEYWDVHIIFIITMKLDATTNMKWEEYLSNCSDNPTLDQFYTFIRNRADVLENAVSRTTNHSESSSNSTNNHNKKFWNNNNNSVSKNNKSFDNLKISSPVASELDLPPNIELADPYFYCPAEVDLLLGADIFWDLVGFKLITLGVGRPVLQESQLGWLKFWEIEELNLKINIGTPEERLCESHFQENVKRLSNGRFSVPMENNKRGRILYTPTDPTGSPSANRRSRSPVRPQTCSRDLNRSRSRSDRQSGGRPDCCSPVESAHHRARDRSRARSSRASGRSPDRRASGRSPDCRVSGRSQDHRALGRSPDRRASGRSPDRRASGRSPDRPTSDRSPDHRASVCSPGRRTSNRRSDCREPRRPNLSPVRQEACKPPLGSLTQVKGIAQRWYEGLPSVLFTWAEWQEKLLATFPSEENYGQMLSDMLAKRARFADSLEEYYYDKLSLVNRCGISGKRAVECILHGIDDRSVRLGAEAAQFDDPNKLLSYLRNARNTKFNSERKLIKGQPQKHQSSSNQRVILTARKMVMSRLSAPNPLRSAVDAIE